MPKLSAETPWLATCVFFGRTLLRKYKTFQAFKIAITYSENIAFPWMVTGSSVEAV